MEDGDLQLRTSPGRPLREQEQEQEGAIALPRDESVDEWIFELPPLPWDTYKTALVRSVLAGKRSQIQLDKPSGRTVYMGPTSNQHQMGTAGSQLPRPVELPNAEGQANSTSFTLAELQLFYRMLLGRRHRLHPQCLAPSASTGCFVSEADEPTTQVLSRKSSLVEHYGGEFSSMAGLELENCCLENMKAFLLKAYLDALHGKFDSATVLNSVACAMAKRLGVHVDCMSDQATLNDLATEAKEPASAFWACLWLDRRLAVLEGRGCHIDHVDVSTTRPLTLLSTSAEVGELPLSLELIFACHVELFWNQDIVLGKLYRFIDDVAKDDAISDGHMKYISWLSSVPSAMRDIPKSKTIHPSLLAFHLCFHTGLILLHRRLLGDPGQTAELSNRRCQESASTITTLLKPYRDIFPNTLSDPMVLHAAFTSALVHLALLLQPDIVSYRSSLRALRVTKEFQFN
ncbi:fungal specific transcription factor domain-containing protein [Aspergillus mulundensis]|uniref:Xylanolytic transcriptional activator regulatory domain-containing protein n=1 Tax=Aspergillus mulundensis TaxID=1810919 RepID=A0A3D8RS15_9EURO|nr:hypothetical protein DSM5745_06821 [Aspergillus mulundensis]RDW76829.1 hypothetical protein DSM5745_06821 [Aspergillus mulundensis]